MSDTAAEAFLEELRLKVDYFRDEFNLTYVAAIGCLELIKQELVLEACEEEDEEEDNA